MLSLRYYLSDTNIHREENATALSLLRDIEARHGIEYELVTIPVITTEFSENPDQEFQRDLSDTQFKPRSRLLHQRTGHSLRDLRSNRGYFYMPGLVAILEDGSIGWYAADYDQFRSYDEHKSLGFLRAVLERGTELLSDLCKPLPAALNQTEEMLVTQFIRSGVLKGRFEREVKVGTSHWATFMEELWGPPSRPGAYDFRKTADLVCHSGTDVWMIEAKRKLNWEALGQVIAYSHLYHEEHDVVPKRGILCAELDRDIFGVCAHPDFDIAVFQRQNDGTFVKVTGDSAHRPD